MILVQLATDEEGQYTGAIKSTPVSVHHKLIELWKRLLNDGLITQVTVIIVPWAEGP